MIAFDGYFAEPSTKDHEHQRKKKDVTKVALKFQLM